MTCPLGAQCQPRVGGRAAAPLSPAARASLISYSGSISSLTGTDRDSCRRTAVSRHLPSRPRRGSPSPQDVTFRGPARDSDCSACLARRRPKHAQTCSWRMGGARRLAGRDSLSLRRGITTVVPWLVMSGGCVATSRRRCRTARFLVERSCAGDHGGDSLVAKAVASRVAPWRRKASSAGTERACGRMPWRPVQSGRLDLRMPHHHGIFSRWGARLGDGARLHDDKTGALTNCDTDPGGDTAPREAVPAAGW